MPLIVGIPTLALCIVQLALELRPDSKKKAWVDIWGTDAIKKAAKEKDQTDTAAPPAATGDAGKARKEKKDPRVFEKKEWTLSADRAALYLQKVLVDPKGEWRRRYRAKEAAIPALPGDYAALMWGVMELYESTTMEKQKKDWLRYAVNLAEKLEENFWDESQGGFFFSTVDAPHIFLRCKTALDDATPSANAMAMMAYAALGKADPENTEYFEAVKAIGVCFARAVNLRPIEHLSVVTAFLKLKNIKEELATTDEKINERVNERINERTNEKKW
jgi:uncharacterized protein YyaL (SSP411 family)